MKLSNQNIAHVMEKIEQFFDSTGVPRKDKLKICVLLEESLLRYQETFGETQEFEFLTRKWFGTPRVSIKIKSKPFNPLEYDDDEQIFSENVMHNLLNYEKARVIYRYESGFNEIQAFSPREIKNLKIPGGSNTISILFAVIFASIAGNFSPETQNLIVNIINPILNTLFGAIIAANIPFVFVSIVASICAMENMVTLNTIGTTVLLRFVKITLFIVVVTIFISEMFFPVVNFSFDGQISASNSDETAKIFNLLLSIVPQNIIEPFLKGNILQIVILALMTGVCVTILGDRVTDFKKIIVESKQIVFKMISIVLKLIHVVIFLSIVKILLIYSFEDFVSLWKIILANYLAFIIVPAAMILRISVKHGVKIADFMRKIYPACLITFTTGSGSASMPKNLEICKQKLGIKENLCDFYIMLSHSLCPTTMTISIIIYAFFAAEFSGVEMTISQLIIVALLSIQFAIATPNENGGIIATMTLLLTQFGFSMDSIGLMMASNMFIVNISGVVGIIVRDSDLFDLSRTKI
ncbi:MAG: cation:dicarboxylase symporter family transporter [Selenomonadaceae bacterium]|nr:cation:dicarboxylase symporter family transporter [Selenomonadaceae bacterium]